MPVRGAINGFGRVGRRPRGDSDRSLVDLTVETARPTTKDGVNSAFADAAVESLLRVALDYTEDRSSPRTS
jgi:glyceraldehyde-3-phosphate dehydrogenase/erythrose-4-phosphate dehydrogenase